VCVTVVLSGFGDNLLHAAGQKTPGTRSCGSTPSEKTRPMLYG
jgi:hypothetical protein